MDIAIIGAGVAGLAAAIRLAAKGHRVQVFEANAYAGGKLTELRLGAYRFDAGPSLFTLPHLVDELFLLAGEDPRRHFQYRPLDEACRYWWPDGAHFVAWKNPDRLAAEAERRFGVPARTVRKALAQSERIWNLSGDLFLAHSLHKTATYLRWPTLKAALMAPSLGLFSTLHNHNRKRLPDARLVQIFDRFATYNGSDPYRAPGILAIIPHLEHGIGAALPVGGMQAITHALAGLATRLGATFHFNLPVDKIEVRNGHVQGIWTKGQLLPFQRVVSNMDVVGTYRRLLPGERQPERILKQERSSSALIFYWGISRSFRELGLHNILFSDDYRKEFRQVFVEGRPPETPTVYVNITSKLEPADAPEGHENWFVLVNAPAHRGHDWQQWVPVVRQAVFDSVKAALGTDVAPHIAAEATLTPQDIEQRTGSFQGALYGTSSNSRMAAFFRHPNFSRRIGGLYFCGGSVHPGGGIPLCLNAAKIVANLFPAAA